MESRVITAHIPVDLAAQIDQLSGRLERPKGWIVKQALIAWVSLEAKRHQLTLDGLADVSAGRVVDHGAIETWASNLNRSI